MLSSLHGVPRVGSPASLILLSTPPSCRPSRVASFPSLRSTADAPQASLPRMQGAAPSGPGLFTGFPKPVRRRRRQELPGSWRTPLCTCPALRPRRDLCARPLLRFGVAFRLSNGVGSRNYLISELNHTARTLAVYASQGGLLPRHARLASGWLASLSRQSCLLGPMKGFRLHRSYHPPSPSFPGALEIEKGRCSLPG